MNKWNNEAFLSHSEMQGCFSAPHFEILKPISGLKSGVAFDVQPRHAAGQKQRSLAQGVSYHIRKVLG